MDRDYKQGTDEQRPDLNPWGFPPNPSPGKPMGEMLTDAIEAFMEFLNGIGQPSYTPPEREIPTTGELSPEDVEAVNKVPKPFLPEDSVRKPFVPKPYWRRGK